MGYPFRNDKGVKVDQDPSNDYMDGYNARDRYWRRRLPHYVIAGVLIGQALEIASYWLGLHI